MESARLVEVPGASSQFIFQDSDRVPAHTLKVVVLGPRPDGSAVDFDAARRFVADRIARVEPFCWAAVNAPLRIGHPYFVTTPIDLDYHLCRATLSSPGSDRELAAAVSEITAGSLDVSRPLWRVWYVDGLADRSRALVFKMHHALADGGASARLISDLFDESLEAPPRVPPTQVRRTEVLRAALGERTRTLLRLPALVLASIITFGKRTLRWIRGAKPSARAFQAPPMPFNDPLTRRRAIGFTHIELSDIKAVRDTFGVTFNAVFLAVCSAAARGYAASAGLALDRSLTASVPVSLGSDTHTWGNHLSTWYVSVASDIADPVDRLISVDENAAAARINQELGDRDLQQRWMQHWRLWSVPGVYLGRAMARASAPPAFNFICSNVRGPAGGSLDGAAIRDLVSVGPVVDGIGLNFTGWSFGDKLAVSIVLCPDHVPDVWDLVDRIGPAMEELVEAARR